MGWSPLGGIIPTLNEWKLFNGAAINTSLFKAEFYGDVEANNTFAWLRSYYFEGEVSSSIRLYPKSEPMIFESYIPQAYLDAGIIVRYFGVRKAVLGRRLGVATEENWGIYLQEWQ